MLSCLSGDSWLTSRRASHLQRVQTNEIRLSRLDQANDDESQMSQNCNTSIKIQAWQ